MVASVQFNPSSTSSVKTAHLTSSKQPKKQQATVSYLSKAAKAVVSTKQNGGTGVTKNGAGGVTSPITLTPYEERLKRLMHPPPTSMTLTAALQLLQPKAPHQSVYLLDPKYLQNWLHWAYRQPVPENEAQRVKEALRLAAVQEGLTPPNDNDQQHHGHGNNNCINISGSNISAENICDPGPIDATALSVEGHPLLLSPLVQVATQSAMAKNHHQPLTLNRSQSAKVNVNTHFSSSSSVCGVPNYDSSNNNSNNNNNFMNAGIGMADSSQSHNNAGAIECLAVPEAFYDTLRSVHGVLCDDGFSVSFQAEESERLLLHHQTYTGRSAAGSSSNGSSNSKGRDMQPRPIEFRRKLVLDETDIHQQQLQQQKATLMDKLLAEEEQLRQPRSKVEVHPLKLVYSHWQPNLQSSELAGFGLVSRQSLAVDALASLLRAAYPYKATQAVRFWCKPIYSVPTTTTSASKSTATSGRTKPPMSNGNSNNNNRANGNLKCHLQHEKEHPTKAGDGYELVDLQMLETRRLTLHEWAQHLVPPSNNRSGGYNVTEIQLLVETRPTVNSVWPRHALSLPERIQVGDFVDAQDVAGKWYEAVVRHVDDTHVTVHYLGWASRWDTKVRRGNSTSIDNNNSNKDASTGTGEKVNVDSASSRVQPPVPLWSRTNRWREWIEVGHELEVRDTSSVAARPKWYKGIVRKVALPNDPVRPLEGGAELETYPIIDSNGNSSNNEDAEKKEALHLLMRTQQILVEVEKEKSVELGGNKKSASARGGSMAGAKSPLAGDATTGDGLTPNPPYLRWVDLYGEEVCKIGTHLKEDDGSKNQGRPVTLQYEYEGNRKPVEVLKSHPTLGAGFMRESLRGSPPAPGSVGLHNLGNSCFLNSIVQCLNHIEPLTQFFLQDKHMADLNRKNPLGSGGNVALAYASLLKKMWSGEYSVLAPRMLKQTVAAFAPQFDNCYQHDSQEFCQFLMDGLHEDLNRVKTKPYVEELEGFGMEDEKAAIESWRKHLLRHDSIIVDHCQGMHRSHLTCPRCGRESIKFDIFSSISLPLVTSKKRTTIKLEDCLEKFMEGEQLDERNAWYCPSCRQHVCALKMIALWSVPDILILHLKRFTFDTCMTSGGMLRSKMDDTVEFPIEGLDLTKHILGAVDPLAPPIYKLFGVSEHVGPTANSGHYTATVRNSIDSQWYRCNDSHVGQTSGEASITGGAYLLFYQRAKGISKWAGMEKAMLSRNVNPYGGLETDQDGFVAVKKTKKKKSRGGGGGHTGAAGEEHSMTTL